MSWAKLVRDIKPEEAERLQAPPKEVVYATDPNVDSGHRLLANPTHDTPSVRLPGYTKGLLIIDANALIKGMDNLLSTADAFVTTTQVVAEIKDRHARELLQRLPYELTVLDPSKESVSAVVACAEKTGDLGTLSRTDIRLCALALDCCKAGDYTLTPIEPHPPVLNNGSSSAEVIMDEVSEAEEEEEEEEEVPQEGEDDSEGEWITPENLAEVQQGECGIGTAFTGGMACVTSDYAMQNTLMHLGVPIVGTSGMRITELRLWLLRCTACFTLVMDTTRQFCPDCGSGDTLKRVNYVVNSDGEKKLFINFKKKISTRGTVYNLPKPRGGKRGTNRNLVLREDQLAHVIRGSTSTKVKERQVMQDDDDLAVFGEAPKHKKRNLADPRAFSSYHKYNVNEKKKARAAHRK